jgi:hypothetical protein
MKINKNIIRKVTKNAKFLITFKRLVKKSSFSKSTSKPLTKLSISSA